MSSPFGESTNLTPEGEIRLFLPDSEIPFCKGNKINNLTQELLHYATGVPLI